MKNNYILNKNRISKKIFLVFFDFIIFNISLFASISLRTKPEFSILEGFSIYLNSINISVFDNYLYLSFLLFFVLPVLNIILFFISSILYNTRMTHLSSIDTNLEVLKNISISSIIFISISYIYYPIFINIFIINWFISISLIIIYRGILPYIIRYFNNIKNNDKIENVSIYGAGNAAIQLAAIIREHPKYNLCVCIDDDIKKQKLFIGKCKVYSFQELPDLIRKFNLSQIFLAIPSLNLKYRKNILNKLSFLSIKVNELPSIKNIIDGKITLSDIKRIKIEDILGRRVVPPMQELINKNIKNKTILVTGAGGSIGSVLCKKITSLKPKLLITFDISEFALYTLNKELESAEIEILSILGSVNHKNKLNKIFKKYNIDTVYHTAAYKHVPMLENNACSGVYNNILGTHNVLLTALENNIKNFILISTDKAVRPSNIMGATKRYCELILQAYSELGTYSTIISMVRFGNVLDSAGSVLPLFRKQIKNGGPLTVTHREIIRYFMSIPEAVDLVIQSGAMAKGGDVFILDMGEPVNILDVAKKMINLSGLKFIEENHPNNDIDINIIGLRPGEKLYEELLIGKNSIKTEHPKIFKALETKINFNLIQEGLIKFKSLCKEQDEERVKIILKKYIPEFTEERE